MWNDNGYAYAKASWIIGKSFLGKRFSQLKGLHSLNDLDRLLFPDDYKELPGRELLTCLEKRIMERSVRQILRVINSYSEPPKLIVRMLKGIEYNDLKECLACIVMGKHEIPVISDIGRFGNVRFDMYPNITAMLKKTEFEYLLSRELKSIQPDMDLTPLEIKLDYRFYQGLIESLPQLSDEDRQTASRILADEISLFNCIMALRLRTYYHKSEAETAKYLMDLKLQSYMYRRKSSLAAEALSSLDLPLDVRQSWRGWRWERFLNPEEAAVHWVIDPRYFQNAALNYLYHLNFHNFHSLPMSVSAIFCFIKLKQYEEELLTSIAEGLSLGMESTDVFRLLEVT